MRVCCISIYSESWLCFGSQGFRCLFQHTALAHWWNASPEAVMGVVTWLASHAQCCGELWQLTFDAILLCLRHVPDWNTRAQLAEQVLTWLHTDALSDSESLYACRCIMYCEPFLHLYDLHDRVLQRIARKNKQATDGTRLYLRVTAESAIYMWSILGAGPLLWYPNWCIDVALESALVWLKLRDGAEASR